MLRILVRRSRDVSYLTDDPALELEGVREGPAQWWWRSAVDATRNDEVQQVLQTSERSAVVGYDLIVAAPRPVSILVALDLEHAPAVLKAHRRAVSDALEYLEQRAVVVRERRDHDDRDVPGRWANVVGFTHGVNRHGEPHVHDHVLVGARPDGARGVLDSRALFAHVATADALYRSSLRAGVSSATPYALWRSFEGVEHVAGLDEGYRVLWGGHFADRGVKQHWSRREALATWHDDLSRFEVHGTMASPVRDPGLLDEHTFTAAFEGRPGVARRHLVQAWANAATWGSSARDVTESVDELYPDMSAARGVREEMLSVHEARMIAETRVRGARPLRPREIESWRQRSREISREAGGRSR
ncbi:MAG: relaxase domain-containing protein [Acidimicrobiaceae bacterium]|nr:relaxase domain-containing protein [Acidimicrobiaceae bacterium]